VKEMQITTSIVIPHLNQPQFLERCLKSLEAQVKQHGQAEVIVVDNGSTQLPTELCNRFPSVQLISEAIPGPGPARNCGIAKSHGDILAFIDADCVADGNWLLSLCIKFEQAPSIQVIGGDVRIGYDDAKNLTALEAYESVFAYRQKEYIEKLHFSGTGNLAMRRGAFQAVGPFTGISLAEDRDWGQRAHQKNIGIHYVSDMIVYHPARRTFTELTRKWDRHIDHDFNQSGKSIGQKIKWLGLTVAVAASGFIDLRKILTTKRLSGFRNKIRAWGVLLRIRFYRARHMMHVLYRGQDISSPKWNLQ
jgi:glycosyltransferase involved in cell wall biosynthesis